MPVKCTLSTAGRISDLVGGEIWIAYRFADLDEEEKTSPIYVRIILKAVVKSEHVAEPGAVAPVLPHRAL